MRIEKGNQLIFMVDRLFFPVGSHGIEILPGPELTIATLRIQEELRAVSFHVSESSRMVFNIPC